MNNCLINLNINSLVSYNYGRGIKEELNLPTTKILVVLELILKIIMGVQTEI